MNRRIMIYDEQKDRVDIPFIDFVTPTVFEVPNILFKKIRKHVDEVRKYPFDSEFYYKLLDELVKYTNVEQEKIIITNGANEAIDIVSRFLSTKTKKSIVAVPTFWQLIDAQNRNSIKTYLFNMLSRKIKIEFNLNKFIKLYTKHKKASIWICNPNNPAGKYIENYKLLKVARTWKKSYLVIDESYYEFANRSIMGELNNAHNNIIVIRSLSKAYGINGARIGYIILNERLRNEVLKYKIPYSTNSIGHVAGYFALRYRKKYKKIWKKVMKNKEWLINQLNRLGLEVLPSETNLVLFKVKNAEEIRLRLLKKGILVLNPGNGVVFNIDHNRFIRITVRSMRENKKLIDALESIL